MFRIIDYKATEPVSKVDQISPKSDSSFSGKIKSSTY